MLITVSSSGSDTSTCSTFFDLPFKTGCCCYLSLCDHRRCRHAVSFPYQNLRATVRGRGTDTHTTPKLRPAQTGFTDRPTVKRCVDAGCQTETSQRSLQPPKYPEKTVFRSPPVSRIPTAVFLDAAASRACHDNTTQTEPVLPARRHTPSQTSETVAHHLFPSPPAQLKASQLQVSIAPGSNARALARTTLRSVGACRSSRFVPAREETVRIALVSPQEPLVTDIRLFDEPMRTPPQLTQVDFPGLTIHYGLGQSDWCGGPSLLKWEPSSESSSSSPSFSSSSSSSASTPPMRRRRRDKEQEEFLVVEGPEDTSKDGGAFADYVARGMDFIQEPPFQPSEITEHHEMVRSVTPRTPKTSEQSRVVTGTLLTRRVRREEDTYAVEEEQQEWVENMPQHDDTNGKGSPTQHVPKLLFPPGLHKERRRASAPERCSPTSFERRRSFYRRTSEVSLETPRDTVTRLFRSLSSLDSKDSKP